MREGDADRVCGKVIELLDEEPEEIKSFMQGEVVTGYTALVRKELEAMRQIRDKIRRLGIQ